MKLRFRSLVFSVTMLFGAITCLTSCATTGIDRNKGAGIDDHQKLLAREKQGNETDVWNARRTAFNGISHDKDYLALEEAVVSWESPQDHGNRRGQKNGQQEDLREGVCTIVEGTRDGCQLYDSSR